MNQQIEAQSLQNEKELKAKLLSVISQNPSGLTKNEMLIKSGIGQELIDYILRRILEEYLVHLEVSENHEVTYTFDLNNKKKSGSSQVLKSLQALARVVLFVGAILVGVSWAFIAIPLAVSILGLYLAAGFLHIFFNQGFQVGVQEYLIYWLGRREEKDKLYEEKIILSFIAQNKYVITIAELTQLMNWSYEKAEQEVVWLLVNYGGEPLVDESAVIIFDFSNLKDSANPTQGISEVYQAYQQNKEEESTELTTAPIDMAKVDVFAFKSWDRKTYLTAKVYLMNYYLVAVLFLGTVFGLVSYSRLMTAGGDFRGILVNPEEFHTLTEQDIETFWWIGIICIIGYLLAVLLGLIVVIRWFVVQAPEQKEKLKAIYKRVLYDYIFHRLSEKALFQSKTLANQLSDFRKQIHKKKEKKSIQTEDVVKEFLVELQAESVAQESGEVAYSFAKIGKELQVIQNKRT